MSTPPEITTLIVDDHEVVREGLRLSLSRAPHIRVIGEASDGASAVALAERRRPNVIIMRPTLAAAYFLASTARCSCAFVIWERPGMLRRFASL